VALTNAELRADNRDYAGTKGLSQNNRHLHFLPAFRDETTGRVELARFADGRVAPMHLLCALPKEWATATDSDGQVTAVLDSIVAGFVRDGEFYTRDQAAAALR
jgi:hypothetical protein